MQKPLSAFFLSLLCFTALCFFGQRGYGALSCGDEGTFKTQTSSNAINANMSEESNCAVQSGSGALDTCPANPQVPATAPVMTPASGNKVDLGICPVMLKPAVAEYHYFYGGTTYYFCCQNCVEPFKANPEKYIKALKRKSGTKK
jgi:YHS domain-containing protein